MLVSHLAVAFGNLPPHDLQARRGLHQHVRLGLSLGWHGHGDAGLRHDAGTERAGTPRLVASVVLVRWSAATSRLTGLGLGLARGRGVWQLGLERFLTTLALGHINFAASFLLGFPGVEGRVCTAIIMLDGNELFTTLGRRNLL